jgi:hypothetical protein
MGLTSVGDIAVLYEKIEQLEASLVEIEESLQLQIVELQEIIFEGDILSEEDSSWEIIRKKRDYLLKSTDWIMTPGSSLDQSAWAAYRQVLRDLPQTYQKTGLASIRWPKRPAMSGPNTIVSKK